MFDVKQNKNNPLLHPYKRNSWEEVSACNGCPVVVGKNLYLVYRAIANPDHVLSPKLFRSTIGIAKKSKTGSFVDRKQLIVPEHDWEKYGCEDPRVTKIDDKYFIFYTALSSDKLGPDSIKVALAISSDLKTIEEKHLITPFNAKAMALFPEKINGKYYAVLTVDTDQPPAKIAIFEFDNISDLYDQEKWQEWYKNLDSHKIELRRSDSDLTEVGAVPVKTKDGWLLIYSHIQNYFSDKKRTFGIEAVLLDASDPKKILGKTDFPFMTPDQIYTKYGFVGEVSFPTGAIINKNNLDIYYGAADTTTCMATLPLDSLLLYINPNHNNGKQIFERYEKNPILIPDQNVEWKNKNVFNPTAIDLDKKIRILYRAQSTNGTSTIGYAESKDGEKIDYENKEPMYIPRADFELKKGGDNCFSGCEDPRVTLIGKKVFMLYTAYNGVDSPNVAVSSISRSDLIKRNFEKWSMPILISPKGHDDKDACLLPKKFKNGYMVIHRIASRIVGDYVNDLDFTPHEIDMSFEILTPRKGMFDSLKVGIAGTPHLIKEGWLMFYHGVDENKVYRVGVALLDKNNPTQLLGRSALPIFSPTFKYELEGDVPSVVFPCGTVIRRDDVYMYYGGADRVVCVAKASLKKILASLK